MDGAINMVNGVLRGINSVSGALGGLIGQTWCIPLLGRISIPRLAKGGTVMPSAGGSIVNVAEAGRPERVEPLDPSGLSQRDHAVIDKLVSSMGGVGGGGISISVTQLPNENGEELAERIARILAFQQRKGGASYA